MMPGVVRVVTSTDLVGLASLPAPGPPFLPGFEQVQEEAAIDLGASRLQVLRYVILPHIFPALAADFEALRRSINRATDPRLVVLSASGDLPGSHPALERGALVLTTADGARRARRQLPSTCEVKVLSRGRQVPVAAAVKLLRAEGYASLLSEAGGTVMGQLVRDELVDEIHLTVSPVLAGRVRGDGNKGLVEGIHLLPEHLRQMRLVSVRRHQSHLFLRYQRT